MEVHAAGKAVEDSIILANDEQLETIFENLLSNSIRAINAKQNGNGSMAGEVRVTLRKDDGDIVIRFEDNGSSYDTISGRGTKRILATVKEVGGKFRRARDPYRAYLRFNCVQ